MDSTPIPIPPARRWKEFRIRVIPGLMFVVVGLLVAWLWSQRVDSANMTGRVIGYEAELRSGQAGYLTPLRAERFESVSAGEVLAEVVTTDPRVLEAQLAMVTAEVEMIRLGMGPMEDRQRNRLNLEGMEMELMNQRIELASANLRRQRLEQEFERASTLYENRMISDDEFERVRSELDVLTLEIEQRTEMLDTMRERVENLQADEAAGGDGSAPAQAAIRLQEERLRLIEAELMPVSLVAPIDGMISRVYRNGGEQIGDGEPILTIQSPHPEYIVGYLPHPLRLEPEVGMEVVVRSRSNDRTEFEAQVVNIGVQVEDMSEVQDPRATPSPGGPPVGGTGLAIKISLNEDVPLRPGEIVDLTLRRN